MKTTFEQIKLLCDEHKYYNSLHDVFVLLKSQGFTKKESEQYIYFVWNSQDMPKLYGCSAADFLICQIRRELTEDGGK